MTKREIQQELIPLLNPNEQLKCSGLQQPPHIFSELVPPPMGFHILWCIGITVFTTFGVFFSTPALIVIGVVFLSVYVFLLIVLYKLKHKRIFGITDQRIFIVQISPNAKKTIALYDRSILENFRYSVDTNNLGYVYFDEIDFKNKQKRNSTDPKLKNLNKLDLDSICQIIPI